MAERIGLSKNVKLEWMELAANQHMVGKTQNEAMLVIDEKIHESITCQANVRTIRAILMNMWLKNQDWFLDAATKVFTSVSPSERIAIHWALLLKRYPVFFDLCTVIGGLFAFRDEITLGQIRTRIFEKWGARDTLQNCLSKNIQMFKELKSIIAAGAPGAYNRNTMTLNNGSIMQLLCAAIIERSGKQYMTWEELIQHPALFPSGSKTSRRPIWLPVNGFAWSGWVTML